MTGVLMILRPPPNFGYILVKKSYKWAAGMPVAWTKAAWTLDVLMKVMKHNASGTALVGISRMKMRVVPSSSWHAVYAKAVMSGVVRMNAFPKKA